VREKITDFVIFAYFTALIVFSWGAIRGINWFKVSRLIRHLIPGVLNNCLNGLLQMNTIEDRPMIKKVLCVDDDALSLTISELMLNSVSFTEQIDTAIDGKDALEYLDKILEEKDTTGKAPQLILLDINMPVMNGWEFLEEFVPAYEEKLPGTKIIILSSTIDPQDFEQAKKFPVVVDFISKPLGLDMLESLKESEHFRVYFAGSGNEDNKA